MRNVKVAAVQMAMTRDVNENIAHAGTSMLAQANQSNQGALSLL